MNAVLREAIYMENEPQELRLQYARRRNLLEKALLFLKREFVSNVSHGFMFFKREGGENNYDKKR
jgi:hypothetical protein